MRIDPPCDARWVDSAGSLTSPRFYAVSSVRDGRGHAARSRLRVVGAEHAHRIDRIAVGALLVSRATERLAETLVVADQGVHAVEQVGVAIVVRDAGRLAHLFDAGRARAVLGDALRVARA